MKFNAAFWKWFGDSKVVDSNGKPLVVYHGTGEKELFSIIKDRGRGIYFSSSAIDASRFAKGDLRHKRGSPKRVFSCYLRVENPLIVNWIGTLFDADVLENQIKEARKHNDGLVALDIVNFDNSEWKKSTTFVVFNPEQIKSATGNDGTWDADDPDIRSNPVDPEIAEIAAAVRYNFIKKGKLKCTEGKCVEMSELLYEMLKTAGVKSSIVNGRFVVDRYENYPHTWIEKDGVIIDISADQFNEGKTKFPPIWIDPPEKYYIEESRYFH